MSIVKGYSRKSNTTYFYEQEMRWNPETGRTIDGRDAGVYVPYDSKARCYHT